MSNRYDEQVGRPGGWIPLLGLAGAAAAAIGLLRDPVTTWTHLLILGVGLVQLGVAGAFLTALPFVSGAGWSVALRRVPEAMTALILPGGIIVLAAQIFCPSLYPWMRPGFHAHGEFQHFWLTREFFLGRSIGYVALWWLLARGLTALSHRQDSDRSGRTTGHLRTLSAFFMVVFGVTSTLASFDWVMSREPGWASTIFGVYLFSGLFVSGLAVMAIVSAWLWKRGPFREVLAERHRHDLGKLLFGMTSFWMYIWFSQYMLIWYVNFPQETSHYVTRQQGLLAPLFWVNVVLCWGVPFLALLPRTAKENVKILVSVSCVALAGHGLDLYLAVLPEHQRLGDVVGILVLTLGAVALGWSVIRRALGRSRLLPVGDPFLVESLPATGHPHAVGDRKP